MTYWNRACVDFAGRVPELGEDRWCVTWQLFTTEGEFVPHANARWPRRSRRAGKCAARSPSRSGPTDRGSRSAPTRPLCSIPTANFTGAINLLVDVSDEQVEALTVEADRCRRLADATFNREVSEILGSMADGYARTAGLLSTTRAA